MTNVVSWMEIGTRGLIKSSHCDKSPCSPNGVLSTFNIEGDLSMATTTQTVREIAMENPAAVRVFEKYGIDYCCGGRVPLAEACATRNLNVDEVIASLGVAATASTPGDRDWVKESLASLAAHIVDTHHAYVTREIPRLNELAAKVVNRHGDTREELPVLQSKLAGTRRRIDLAPR
jgi:iron-sulfur cluster repair di-iron protein